MSEDNGTMRESLLGIRDLPVHHIGPVPRWDRKVWIRELSVAERNASSRVLLEGGLRGADLAKLSRGEIGDVDVNVEELLRARLRRVAMSLCEPDGTPVFTDVEEGIRWCEARNAEAIDWLATKVDAINGLSDEGEAEIEGNSDAPPAG